jgi:formylglycine-generating enzyme required for sulfatase activity
MVVIAPGRFTMGSTSEDRRRLGVHPMFDVMETPRHDVTVAYAFAYGRYSVTFDEWDACVADGGCNGYRPPDEGWGRGRRPVIHVNFEDAQAYVAWLGAKTGQRYRLPSEAEFEYAARGGTTTAFHTGDDISPAQANFGSLRGQTVPVGTFPPNPFGLYEINGNVAQWMQDCHHDSYEGAPADGSAWLTGPCETRDVRGGGWSLVSYTLRTAQRIGDPPQQRNSHLGFRVVRELGR